MGALVPLEDLHLLERLKKFASRREVEAALREIEDDGTASWNSIKKSLGSDAHRAVVARREHAARAAPR